jgi:glycine cleavage system H protein
MNVPKELLYTESHEWIKMNEDGTAAMGLTDFAQHSMGDIVFINLPAVGDTLSAGDSIGDVESVKAVSDVYCPVSGTVTAVNEALFDSPELVNKAPYESWLITLSGVGGLDALLTAGQYEEILAKEGE